MHMDIMYLVLQLPFLEGDLSGCFVSDSIVDIFMDGYIDILQVNIFLFLQNTSSIN